jgi:hypothetical protein
VTNSFLIRTGDDAPVAAAAPHDGHALRADVRAASALGAEQRLREEDPFAAQWAEAVDTRLIGLRSRFEVDLNRPRERAVYQRGQGAWGLHVWRDIPPPSMVTASLAEYDSFYAAAGKTFPRMRRRRGRFVVLYLHSYNHRRAGPTAPPWSGSGGSTTTACSARSDTFPRWSMRSSSIVTTRPAGGRWYSRKRVSGEPGAVQLPDYRSGRRPRAP